MQFTTQPVCVSSPLLRNCRPAMPCDNCGLNLQTQVGKLSGRLALCRSYYTTPRMSVPRKKSVGSRHVNHHVHSREVVRMVAHGCRRCNTILSEFKLQSKPKNPLRNSRGFALFNASVCSSLSTDASVQQSSGGAVSATLLFQADGYVRVTNRTFHPLL